MDGKVVQKSKVAGGDAPQNSCTVHDILRTARYADYAGAKLLIRPQCPQLA